MDFEYYEKNQIFKSKFKNSDIFENYVHANLDLENNYYLFNENIFKKLLYNKKIYSFIESLKGYYYKNKMFYLMRQPIKYKEFVTILRQICKYKKITMKTTTKFINSRYSPEYYIFLV